MTSAPARPAAVEEAQKKDASKPVTFHRRDLEARTIGPIDRHHEIAYLRQFGPELGLIDAGNCIGHDNHTIEVATDRILDSTYALRRFRHDRRDLSLDAVRVRTTRRISAGPRRHEANGFGEDVIKLGLPRGPRLREVRHTLRSICCDGPTLIHDAHLVMSLECKGLLIWILSERPSAAAVGFGADGVVVQVSRSDHPGRAFA